MKIIFNLVKCGLANNGGSQTLIRSAVGLRKLGHEVIILLDKPSNFTWFAYEKEILFYIDPKLPLSEWPKCDIIMATACSTVGDAVDYPHVELNRKFYWVRAIETWAMPLSKLKEGYQSRLNIICNSEWQCNFLHSMNINSEIQYPGVPIEEINRLLINHIDKKKTVGALFSTKTRKCADHIVSICNKAHSKGLIEHLYLLSNENNNQYFDLLQVPFTVLIRPSFSDKIKMMSECMIWLATTCNEGLHIPPMEAGLCGCNLVANGLDDAGMGDYAINEVSSLNFRQIDYAVDCIDRYVNDPKMRKEHSDNLKSIINKKIGNVETNMKKLELKFFNALDK